MLETELVTKTDTDLDTVAVCDVDTDDERDEDRVSDVELVGVIETLSELVVVKVIEDDSVAVADLVRLAVAGALAD